MDCDARDATCFIFTYRDGLLSRVGHDLKLAVQQFTVSVTPAGVRAEFDPGSLRVISAMRHGAEDPTALSDRDRRQIDRHIAASVLRPVSHPRITFHGELAEQGEGLVVNGHLSLAGVTRPVTAAVARHGARWNTRIRLDQTQFGIVPFSALLGTLRVQAAVDIKLDVPALDRS